MKPSPRIFTGSLLPALTAALLATATQSSSAATMVSNLGNKNAGVLNVRFLDPNGEIRAVTFTTGATATQLDSVTLDMQVAGVTGGGFGVSIYGYSVTGPSGLLASLSGSSNPATAGAYTYTDGSSLTLAANTTYFVVASVPQTSPDKSYAWSNTEETTETSSSGWSIGNRSWYRENGGSSWTQLDFDATGQMSIQASAIPEPGVMLPLPVLLASGLLLRWRRK